MGDLRSLQIGGSEYGMRGMLLIWYLRTPPIAWRRFSHRGPTVPLSRLWRRKTRALKKTLFWSCKLRNPFINVKGEYRANTLQISCEYFAKVVNPCDGARTTAEPVIGSRVHSHFATATTGAARAHERARARVSGPIPLHLRYLPISRHIPPWI